MTLIDSEIARLRETLAGQRKPNSLVRAERQFQKERVERARLKERYAEACSAAHQESATKPTPEMRLLDGEIAMAIPRLNKARDELSERRAEYSPAFLSHVGPLTASAMGVVGGLIKDLDEALGIMVDVNNFAEMNSLPVPRRVQTAKQLRDLVWQARRLINEIKNGDAGGN